MYPLPNPPTDRISRHYVEMAKYEWFIRYDGSYDEGTDIVKYIKAKCSSYILYEHPAKATKGIHVHGYIQTDITDDTIREQIKKSQHIKGYCRKPKKTLLNCIAYMSKGKLDPKLCHAVSTEIISNGKSIGFDKDDIQQYKEELSTEAKLNEIASKKLTQFEIEQQIYTDYVLEHKDYEIKGIIYKDLHDTTVRILKTHKKGRYDTYVMRTMESVSVLINPNDQWLRIQKRFHAF